MTPTEMTFTAMARVAAGEGDGARAESLVRSRPLLALALPGD